MPSLLPRRAGMIAALALCLLLCAFTAFADDPQTVENDTPDPGTQVKSWTDQFHLETTEALVDLSEYLDSFFPNPDNQRFDYRRSRLQAQLGLQVDTNGDVALLQRLYGRVVLPRAEEQLSLYFSGTSEAPETDQDAPRDEPFLLLRVADTRLRFGLNTGARFVFLKSDYYLAQYQIGIRFLPDWDPYHELNGRLRLPFGKFLFQPGQTLFWRQQDGYGETTAFDLDYAFGHGRLLRLHGEGTLSEESNGYEHRYSLTFLHQLTKTRGYAVFVKAEGETSPVQRMTKYITGITWKTLVYRDWLYVDTGVNVLFAEDVDFEPVPALLFSLVGDFNGAKQSRLPLRYAESEPPALQPPPL